MRTASVDFLLCRGPAAACCSGSDLCRCGRLLSDGRKTSRNKPPSDLLLNLKTEIIQGGEKKKKGYEGVNTNNDVLNSRNNIFLVCGCWK